MSHLEQAISDAVKGGYSWKGMTSGALIGYLFALSTTTAPAILLDPDFWRCLGKSRRWTGEPIRMCVGCGRALKSNEKECKCDDRCIYHFPGQWLVEWHRFIDHLAEGKDIESFFASISTNN